MIYDHDIKTIVVLNHQRSLIGDYPQFWPSESSGGGTGRQNYGRVFCVDELDGRDHEAGRFRSHELKLMKQEVAPHK
jgi:hypothetical protein